MLHSAAHRAGELRAVDVNPAQNTKPDKEGPYLGMAGTRGVSLPTGAIVGFGHAVGAWL